MRLLPWALVAAAFATVPGFAEQPVRPLPKVGSCPTGYYSAGRYCIPGAGGHARGAIERIGGACPLGFYSSGSYCLSGASNEREAIPRRGDVCPLGWFTSGAYCLRSR